MPRVFPACNAPPADPDYAGGVARDEKTPRQQRTQGGRSEPLIFILAMLAGMALYELQTRLADKPQ